MLLLLVSEAHGCSPRALDAELLDAFAVAIVMIGSQEVCANVSIHHRRGERPHVVLSNQSSLSPTSSGLKAIFGVAPGR